MKKINFPEITRDQILKSIDTSNPFHNNFPEIPDSTVIKDYQEKNQVEENENENQDKIQMQIYKGMFTNDLGNVIESQELLTDIKNNQHKIIDSIDIDLINNTFISNILVYVNFFLLSLLMIIYIYLIYNIIMLTWKSFANVINYIIMGIIWIFATFVGIIQVFRDKPSNKKGWIISIHRNALKAEWYYDYFLQTLAMANSKNQYVFWTILGIGMGFIFIVIIKCILDMIGILNVPVIAGKASSIFMN